MDRSNDFKSDIKAMIDSEAFSEDELLAVLGFLEALNDKDSKVREYTVKRLIDDSMKINQLARLGLVR